MASVASTESENSLAHPDNSMVADPFDSDSEQDLAITDTDVPTIDGCSDDGASTDDNEGSAWQPPTPQDLDVIGESAQRLLVFQAMPAGAQARVVELHLHRNHAVDQAIHAVVTEQRHNLLALPVPAREAHTSRVRLTLAQVDERVLDQAIALHVLIQALPARHRTTGHHLLRMVANDPRDVKGLIGARRFAADNMGSNPMINRLLNNMADNAFAFHHNNDELRSLRQYDRHQPSPEPLPLACPPDGMVTAQRLLENKRCIVERVDEYRQTFRDYQDALCLWFDAICRKCGDHRGDPTANAILTMQELWRSNPQTTAPDMLNDILKIGIDMSAWNDPETCDPTSILLGPFAMMCLGVVGRPDYCLLNRLVQWEDWHLASPAREARGAARQMWEMWDIGVTYLKEVKEVLKAELQDHGHLFCDVPSVLAALEKYRPDEFGAQLTLIDPQRVPTTLLSRIITVETLWSMCAKLSYLRWVTLRLGNALEDAKVPDLAFVEGTPMFPMWARAYQREYLVGCLSEFSDYHANATQDLKDMVASCRHPRARTLMLLAFPPGASANVERVRDIAVAARVEQTIVDSAEMLWNQQQDISAATALIQQLEVRHLTALRDLPADQIYHIILDASHSHRELYHQQALPHTTGLAAIGPALRTAIASTTPDRATETLTTLTTASLHHPLRTVLQILTQRRDPTAWPLWIAPPDIHRMATLLLRALYLAHTPTHTHALILTRHTWTHGLLHAWTTWHLRLRTLLRPVHDHLTTGAGVHRAADADSAEARLAWNIAVHHDWEGVAMALLTVPGVVAMGQRDAIMAHLGRGRRLRAATDLWVAAPDVVDWRVLPAGLGGVGAGRGEEEEEVLARMHRLVRFEGVVLDGGRLVVRDCDWV